ncbi:MULTISPECIES: type VII secretion system-associated protein [unclassified Streptomyces]|uniref:type VII secretion system-associated protein n=1 Tax=unclassified Streptomyces TaxID=2593676 RepID=UPI001BE932F1|nr:type VII secretion system-associated protein [Streptomyces sp. McG3]MBT2899184.1 type VII secretion system-associated protein [Streptomyces sp. McG3]
MAEAPALNLNKAWLQSFLDNDLVPFLAEIKKMRDDGTTSNGTTVPGIPSLQGGEDGSATAAGFYDGQKKPLAIGTMAADENGRTNGGYLVKCLNGLVDQLDDILKLQVELFEQIEEDLEDTIEELFKTQDGNLEKIDGKDMIDFFEGVDEVLSESAGGGSDGDEDD